MRIVSFNVNGIRARPHQLRALRDTLDPDVIGLQETKVQDSEFPREMVEELGYHVLFHGQKGHYGVALLSRQAPLAHRLGLPDDGEDAQRRLITATYPTPGGEEVTVINGYFPQGESLLFRKSKGTAAKLAYLGHLLIENRNGLVVDAQVTQATGTAEREAAVDMVEALGGTHRMTLGADKNYDTKGCVDALRCANVTPHVAQNTSNRSSAIDGRTTHHAGYATSQRFRKRIEECFGWAKTIGGLRKSHFVGREKLDFRFVLTMTAYNLVRMRNLGVVAC